MGRNFGDRRVCFLLPRAQTFLRNPRHLIDGFLSPVCVQIFAGPDLLWFYEILRHVFQPNQEGGPNKPNNL